MKIVYKGNRKVAIPGIGLFKPNEPIEVPDARAKILVDEKRGFEKYYERPKKRARETQDEDEGG